MLCFFCIFKNPPKTLLKRIFGFRDSNCLSNDVFSAIFKVFEFVIFWLAMYFLEYENRDECSARLLFPFFTILIEISMFFIIFKLSAFERGITGNRFTPSWFRNKNKRMLFLWFYSGLYNIAYKFLRLSKKDGFSVPRWFCQRFSALFGFFKKGGPVLL